MSRTRIQTFLKTHIFIRICDRSPGKRFPNNTVSVSGFFRELKQRAGRRRRQRERETSKGLDKQNNNFYVHHAFLFISLPSLHDYDLKVRYLISRFVENVNTRQRFSFSLPELRCSPLEFIFNKSRQHLSNIWTRWNRRDKVWNSANSLLTA